MPATDLIDTAIYSAAYWSAFTAFTFGWSLRAWGRRNLPPSGPVLLVSNHQSFIDPVLIGAVANRRLTYLARSNLFDNPALARVIRHFDAVPIDRGFGKEGLQTVLKQLDRGKAVVMFPEGERSYTGELQPLKPGVSLLLKRVQCPVIPVGVAGVYQAWSRHMKYPIPSPLFWPDQGRSLGVAFGPVIPPEQYREGSREQMLENVGEQIRLAYLQAERIRRKPV